MSSKKTTTAPTSTAIAPVENAIVPVDSGVMAIAADHTSNKLITDEEAMERLGEGVNLAVQRAQDSIPAAGINLLRGTRDFVAGTQYVGASSSNRKSDGFAFNESPQNKYIGDDGFTVLKVISTSCIGSLSPVDNGATYTAFADIMFTEDTTTSGIVLYSSLFRLNENNTVSQVQNFPSITRSDVEQKYGQIENNRWYHLKMTWTPKVPDDGASYYITALAGRSNIKKMGLYKGDIANPTWSASPFDVVEKQDSYLMGQKILESNTNLNDIKTPGFYYTPNNDVASTIINAPSSLKGISFALAVFSCGGVFVHQVALGHRGQIENRAQVAGAGNTWTNWNTISGNLLN